MSVPDLFEVIHSARAMRRFKPDPVPDELITQILEAAIAAPSGGNVQDWLFVVITDPEQRRLVGAAYAKGLADGAPVLLRRRTSGAYVRR